MRLYSKFEVHLSENEDKEQLYFWDNDGIKHYLVVVKNVNRKKPRYKIGSTYWYLPPNNESYIDVYVYNTGETVTDDKGNEKPIKRVRVFARLLQSEGDFKWYQKGYPYPENDTLIVTFSEEDELERKELGRNKVVYVFKNDKRDIETWTKAKL